MESGERGWWWLVPRIALRFIRATKAAVSALRGRRDSAASGLEMHGRVAHDASLLMHPAHLMTLPEITASHHSIPDAQIKLRLGEALLAEQLLSRRDLDSALLAQKSMGNALLGEVLVALGLVANDKLAKVLAVQLGVELVLEANYPEAPPDISDVPRAYWLDHDILPLACQDNILTIACTEPQNSFVRDALALATGCRVQACLALKEELQSALRRFYVDLLDDQDNNPTANEDGQDSGFIEHLRDLASEAPVIRAVSQILDRVVDLRASDIHIEPGEDALNVRYRVDGVLQVGDRLNLAMAPAVISRFKLLAHLDIAERRLPQDGRTRHRVKGRDLDLRVSSLPTAHGESVVLRVLDRASVRQDVFDADFAEDTRAAFTALLDRPHGIVMVTGPTGSGKTTTLYSALARFNADALKIITVEDPIEYQLPGINHVQVHPQIGLSFASALRSILRQDPDIIMIGEMRDGETAQIAVQASLTGHLVLSTLHTNTAVGAITRLLDMGVERYLLASTINGVLSQRLLRTLCPHCKKSVPPDRLNSLSVFKAYASELHQAQVYQAQGCAKCRHTGYLGRAAIHELFTLSEPMQKALASGASQEQLFDMARSAGMRTLFEDGMRKVLTGSTSVEELLRVTRDQGGV